MVLVYENVLKLDLDLEQINHIHHWKRALS